MYLCWACTFSFTTCHYHTSAYNRGKFSSTSPQFNGMENHPSACPHSIQKKNMLVQNWYCIKAGIVPCHLWSLWVDVVEWSSSWLKKTTLISSPLSVYSQILLCSSYTPLDAYLYSKESIKICFLNFVRNSIHINLKAVIDIILYCFGAYSPRRTATSWNYSRMARYGVLIEKER